MSTTVEPPATTTPSGPGAWEPRRQKRSAADQARTSYYDQPVIHGPHWNWLIITYFFLGGIAGGSYVIATIAELVGAGQNRPVTRAGRLLSLAALLPCPLLLILDLGRPERFLNMLRVLKLRSPMSLGTWGLTGFGGFCLLSALSEAAQAGWLGSETGLARLLRRVPSRLVGVLGMGPAFFVSGYTGVLLAATAVPLWTRNYLLLGPLFLVSGLASAAAALALALVVCRGASRGTLSSLERLSAITHLVELGLVLAMRANTGARLARPLAEGRLGRLHWLGAVGLGLLVPLALESRAVPESAARHPARAALSSVCALVGSYLLRYVMVTAGRASAADPYATFDLAGSPPPEA